jgi:hypothetical protein
MSSIGHRFVYAHRADDGDALFVVETRFDEENPARAASSCVLLGPRSSRVIARFEQAVASAYTTADRHVVVLADGSAWSVTKMRVSPHPLPLDVPNCATDNVAGHTATLHADGTVSFQGARVAVPGAPTTLCLRPDGEAVFLGSRTLGLLLLQDGVVSRVRPSLRAHHLARSGDDVVIVSDLFVSIWSDGDFMTIDLSSTIRAVEAA